MDFKSTKTYLNLAKSFAGESQAHIRYKFIEYGSRKEGYEAMADLINNVVVNEFNHARMFYTMLQKHTNDEIKNIDICSGYPFKERWDLEDNLRIAAEDETFESTKIYPEYAKIAREEGYEEIAKLYEDIIQVETCHKKLFKDLYKQFKTKTMYKKTKPVKWKCKDCGYEATSKEAWDICPLCKAKQGFVMLKIDDGA